MNSLMFEWHAHADPVPFQRVPLPAGLHSNLLVIVPGLAEATGTVSECCAQGVGAM
jgi:hypothetical protein